MYILKGLNTLGRVQVSFVFSCFFSCKPCQSVKGSVRKEITIAFKGTWNSLQRPQVFLFTTIRSKAVPLFQFFIRAPVVSYMTKTCLYNFDPLKHHFHIVKLCFEIVGTR